MAASERVNLAALNVTLHAFTYQVTLLFLEEAEGEDLEPLDSSTSPA
jgi:hypothetical protein